tara:strand:- start:14901 stop:15041 length:141 start_codon:yes stop_codon:yes gene_type:complete
MERSKMIVIGVIGVIGVSAMGDIVGNIVGVGVSGVSSGVVIVAYIV